MIILTEMLALFTCVPRWVMCQPNVCVTHFFPANLSRSVVIGICSKGIRTDCGTGGKRALGSTACASPALLLTGLRLLGSSLLGYTAADRRALLGLLLRVLGSLHISRQGLRCLALISRRLRPQYDSGFHSHREEAQGRGQGT